MFELYKKCPRFKSVTRPFPNEPYKFIVIDVDGSEAGVVVFPPPEADEDTVGPTTRDEILRNSESDMRYMEKSLGGTQCVCLWRGQEHSFGGDYAIKAIDILLSDKPEESKVVELSSIGNGDIFLNESERLKFVRAFEGTMELKQRLPYLKNGETPPSNITQQPEQLEKDGDVIRNERSPGVKGRTSNYASWSLGLAILGIAFLIIGIWRSKRRSL